jgi:glycosyltransferase involved in cell wall biosynthesis
MFRKSTIHKIPFGVDKEIFHQGDRIASRRKFGIPEGNFVVLFRAASGEFKGLKIIRGVLQNIDGSATTIITLDEIGRVDMFLNKFQIIELGWVEDDSFLAEVYTTSDVFLMPSRAESFGMMAIEAMSCSIPVIASNNTALSETVNYGGAGILIDNDDVEAFTREVERLRDDKSYHKEISARGLVFARERYDIVRFNDSIYNVYRGRPNEH